MKTAVAADEPNRKPVEQRMAGDLEALISARVEQRLNASPRGWSEDRSDSEAERARREEFRKLCELMDRHATSYQEATTAAGMAVAGGNLWQTWLRIRRNIGEQ